MDQIVLVEFQIANSESSRWLDAIAVFAATVSMSPNTTWPFIVGLNLVDEQDRVQMADDKYFIKFTAELASEKSWANMRNCYKT